jgi:hypothetical protein
MAAVAKVQYFLGQYIYRWTPLRMGVQKNIYNFLTQRSGGSSIDFGYCSLQICLKSLHYYSFRWTIWDTWMPVLDSQNVLEIADTNLYLRSSLPLKYVIIVLTTCEYQGLDVTLLCQCCESQFVKTLLKILS